MRFPLILLCFLVLSRAAHAGELYVETAGVADREEAMALLQKAEDAGFPGQIVRRFRRGQGWEFVIRSQPCADDDTARKTSEGIKKVTGLEVAVLDRNGQIIALAAGVTKPEPEASVPPPEVKSPEPVVRPKPIEAPEEVSELAALGEGDSVAGRQLLDAVIRAHGSGVSGEEILKKADMLHFRFEREVWADDGTSLRVWHDFWRDKGRMRLEVKILDGAGKNSTSLVTKDGGWVLVDGKVQPQETASVAEAIGIFAPEQIVSQALDVPGLDTVRGARLVGTETLDGKTLARLALETENNGVARSLAVDEVDHRIREDSMKADVGEVAWRYRDYHELDGGVVVPFQVDVWREGQLKERISILDLASRSKGDANLFTPDSLKP